MQKLDAAKVQVLGGSAAGGTKLDGWLGLTFAYPEDIMNVAFQRIEGVMGWSPWTPPSHIQSPGVFRDDDTLVSFEDALDVSRLL